MKKIINGKLYNTETAKALGTYATRLNARDWHYCEETLYVNQNGVYFLHGEGGPLSKYAIHEGHSHWSGEDITPLLEKEARQWAEDNLKAERYESIFGAPEEAS